MSNLCIEENKIDLTWPCIEKLNRPAPKVKMASRRKVHPHRACDFYVVLKGKLLKGGQYLRCPFTPKTTNVDQSTSVMGGSCMSETDLCRCERRPSS